VSLRNRTARVTTAATLVAIAGSAAIAFSARDSGDYPRQVEPAVRALAHADLSRFLDLQPAYGALAALVEAPFAAVAVHVGGGDSLLVYRLGLLPCLLALGMLGVMLARSMARRGRPPAQCLLAGALVLANPATLKAVELGHPEELLTAALVVGAVLAAGSRRPLGGAVLLGLALASKQWAVLAVPAVALLTPAGRRLRVLAVAVAVLAVFTAPLALGNPGAFVDNLGATKAAVRTVSRLDVWWAIAPERTQTVRVGEQTGTVEVRRLPRSVTALGRPLAVVLAVAIALAAARRGRTGLEDCLALLALVLLLRCLLDPVNASYYHVPFLTSLLAWESLRRRGLPLLTLLASSALAATLAEPLVGRPALDNAFYLGWTTSVAALMATVLFRPEAASRLLRGIGLEAPLAAPLGAQRLPRASGT
jgi:hypothetical protein